MVALNYRVRREFKSGAFGLLRVGTILTPEEARSLKNFKALVETNYLKQIEVEADSNAPATGKGKKR